VSSIDRTPWAHPFLTPTNLERFREFSDTVHAAALRHARRRDEPLDIGFAVNLAQSMYKWATLAKKYGASATLYLHPQDHSAISRPEWEEFDGEFDDVLDGPRFLADSETGPLQVPVIEPPNVGSELWEAHHDESRLRGWQRTLRRHISAIAPDAAFSILASPAMRRLRRRAPTVRHQLLIELAGMYPYFAWAELLSKHDVVMIASAPFPAYASGKPYCILSVGGDLQFDCGRDDALGEAMRRSFRHARFIFVTNPHTLGHCRRFGFTNAVYLPYPMDTDRYTPAPGHARAEWQRRFGGEVFVLTASRVDAAVKGQGAELLEMLFSLVTDRPEVRLLFLGWGADAAAIGRQAMARGLQDRVIVLPPVGKQRLIDYYRSSDIVLDQFVFGYLGATALEAASTGKPVVMKLRSEQYAALCGGDVAPVVNATTPADVRQAMLGLIDSEEQRHRAGRLMREWIVRQHGEQTTVPLLLALLRFAADQAHLPQSVVNPLTAPLQDQERAYHAACVR
jgi:glycosyltransferase involved in cell wall biosynthesis